MLKYCYLIVLSHLYISLFNIWFSVTKELHKKKKTIYKGKEFTPFGFKQIIHIIDWDVNIWPSNILYIKLTVATKKSFPSADYLAKICHQHPSHSFHFLQCRRATFIQWSDFPVSSVKSHSLSLLNNVRQSSLCWALSDSHSQFLVTITIKQQPWEQYHIMLKTTWIITELSITAC